MAAELDHRGPGRKGPLRRRGRRARVPAARDHRPQRRRRPALRERGRRAPARPQRRGLQLRRAPRRARGEGTPLPQRHRHRGRARLLPGVGRELRRAVQRDVGLRALGRAPATAVLLARPLRREAVLLPPRRPGASCSRASSKAFRGDAGTRLEANPRAVRDYLDQGYLEHTDDTFFAGIRKLPAAHTLTLDAGRPSPAPLLVARGARPTARRSRRRRARADARLGAAAAAQRRPARDMSLGRARLVRDHRRRRPPPPDRGRERAAGRRAPEDLHGLLRGSRLRRAPVRRGSRPADRRRPTLDLVLGRRPRREPPRDRRGPGRAVRLDEHRRAVVRDARREGGRAHRDARRPGRRRGARRLPRLLRLPVRRPAPRAPVRRPALRGGRLPHAARGGKRGGRLCARAAVRARGR